MEQIAKETYEGKLKRGELSTEHILKTYSELEDGAKEGYGKNWLKINGDTGFPNQESIKLQKNLWKFSGAKNFAMLEQINQLLVKNGKTVSWEVFKKEVMKLNTTYNKNYLQAEWQTAKQAAKMAANWESYTANADIYPNLEYRTQQDGRVREAHAGLHGVVAPINSDFWKSHYPPNGWRCRCYVVQTAAEPTKDIPKISEKDHPLEFRGNVGISGEIFKETDANKGKPHPYFALAKKQPEIENTINKIIRKDIQEKAIKKLKGEKINHLEITDIEFSTRGIKEAINQPHEDYWDKNWIVPYLDTIIPKSKYIGKVDDIKHNPMVENIIVFEILLNNRPSYILIRKMKDGRKIFYTISDADYYGKNAKK